MEYRSYIPTHPRALLALQALGLALLVLLLVQVLLRREGVLLLQAILGGIFALCILHKPHWGVLIILTAWFVEIGDLAGVSYAVSGLLLIPVGLSILRDRGTWLTGVPQIKIFLIIGFVFLISSWWSEFKYPMNLYPDKDHTVRQMGEFITHLVWLVFFLYFITTRERIEMTVWLVVGLIAAAALSAVVPFLLSGGIKRAAAGFSLAENSNRLAYISLFAASFLWFYRFNGGTGRWTIWTLPLLFLFPVTVLTAGSRSGFLQMATFAAVVIKNQKGWSAAKRVYCVFFMGLIAVLIMVVVPATNLVRATTFDAQVDAPGQHSLQNRMRVISSAFKLITADPVFGTGIGNFPWVAPSFYGSSGHTHNSYLWAVLAGGFGVLGLYLLLFYVTRRMLRELERAGPPELLWLTKALQVNLLLFLIFSAFADFWLSDFLYLIVGLTVAMMRFWRRQEQDSAQTTFAYPSYAAGAGR